MVRGSLCSSGIGHLNYLDPCITARGFGLRAGTSLAAMLLKGLRCGPACACGRLAYQFLPPFDVGVLGLAVIFDTGAWLAWSFCASFL